MQDEEENFPDGCLSKGMFFTALSTELILFAALALFLH